MIGKNTKRRRKRVPHKKQLVVGTGGDMQFDPATWQSWQEDACDRDDWKHGRVSDAYRTNYDQIFNQGGTP